MFFYFVVMIFVTTIWRHSHFLFIRSCNFNWIACVTSFFALSGASFLFMRVIKFFGHTWLTSLSKMTSSLWNWVLFTLIQRDKVKWVCITLNEGYYRAANRGSKNLYRFLIKIEHISLQWKAEYFWSVFFTVFLDCRSTKLLRLFSGNLPAMFLVLYTRERIWILLI